MQELILPVSPLFHASVSCLLAALPDKISTAAVSNLARGITFSRCSNASPPPPAGVKYALVSISPESGFQQQFWDIGGDHFDPYWLRQVRYSTHRLRSICTSATRTKAELDCCFDDSISSRSSTGFTPSAGKHLKRGVVGLAYSHMHLSRSPLPPLALCRRAQKRIIKIRAMLVSCLFGDNVSTLRSSTHVTLSTPSTFSLCHLDILNSDGYLSLECDPERKILIALFVSMLFYKICPVQGVCAATSRGMREPTWQTHARCHWLLETKRIITDPQAEAENVRPCHRVSRSSAFLMVIIDPQSSLCHHSNWWKTT